MSEAVVIRTQGLMSGEPCFRGTRVRVETLSGYLAEGYPLAEILDEFPTLDREDCKLALQAGLRNARGGAGGRWRVRSPSSRGA